MQGGGVCERHTLPACLCTLVVFRYATPPTSFPFFLPGAEPEVVTRVADAVFSYVSAMAKGGPPSEAQANTLASLLTTLADQMQLRAAGSGASGGEGGFYAVGGAGDGGAGFGGSDDPLMACLEDDEFDRFRFTLAKVC